jgi:hypothetical protein
VNMLANEFQGVRLRKWNSERAMILAPAILNRKHGVAKASQITKLIGHRLDLWEAGRYAELVNEVVITGGSGVAGRNPAEWGEKEVSDSVAKTYNNMVLDGKIRGAMFGLLPREDREGHFVLTINAPKQVSLFWMYFGLNIQA